MANPVVPPHVVKVLLVEDHAVVREGLVSVIGFLPECSLVGAVGGGAEALAAVQTLRPDVLLLDLHLPDMSGLEVLRRLRTVPAPPATLVLTSSDGDHTIRQALALGARGYFLKGGAAEALAQALQCVALGGRYLSPGASDQLVEHIDSPTLSLHETNILRFASMGLSNRQIADEMKISERTVKFHFNSVFAKLKTTDRTSAVVIALRRGILEP